MRPWLVGCCVLGAVACAPQERFPTGRLVVEGSSTLGPFIEEVRDNFLELTPEGVEVTVNVSSSASGIQALADGTAEVAMVSRDLHPEDFEQVPDAHAVTVLRDALVIIVHPSNPLSVLTEEQVEEVFLGELTDWAEVGGTPGPITLFAPEASSGTADFFRHVFLDGEEPVGATAVGANEIVEQVAQTPNGIGFASLGEASTEGVKILALELLEVEVYPDEESFETGAYPAIRPLSLVTRGVPTGLAEAFIRYVLSHESHEEADELGFIEMQ